MSPAPPLLHHGEPTDPILLKWINDLIDQVVNIGPVLAVVVLGVVFVAAPATVLFIAMRRRHGK